jgi:hypothetical protein
MAGAFAEAKKRLLSIAPALGLARDAAFAELSAAREMDTSVDVEVLFGPPWCYAWDEPFASVSSRHQ